MEYFKIGNKKLSSRLIIGTGKYKNLEDASSAISASKAEIVTVAIRRIKVSEKIQSQEASLINMLNWKKFILLPNTAGCRTAEEAIRISFLARELAYSLGQTQNSLIKLEVISDQKYLLPDPIGTLKAAKFLIKEGFEVLPYINADPILAKHLEEIGCSSVMPLASPIGSGQGIRNEENLKIIIENSNIPVIIDAGIGKPSDACKAMELGASAVLLNTAIAGAQNPTQMAEAMAKATKSGHQGFLAGYIKTKKIATPSSPNLDIR